MAGDPVFHCSLCGQTYYTNFHFCTGVTTAPYPQYGNLTLQYPVYPSVTNVQVASSPPWECPRCHQIWAYWVAKCDCTPPAEKCIICGQPGHLMDRAPYPSQHDGEPVCQECIAGFIDKSLSKESL